MTTQPRVLLGMSGGVDSSVSAVLLLEQGYEVIGGFMKNWSNGTPLPPLTISPDRTVACDILPPLTISPYSRGRVNLSEECSWKTERRDAMRVAAQLGIEFHTFDFEAEYRKLVYEYMINEYKAGRTPNPDVLCNKYMKFDLFMREADKLGCEFVATGHYARVIRDTSSARSFASAQDQMSCAARPCSRAMRDVDVKAPSILTSSEGEREGSRTSVGVTRLLAGVDQNKDQSYFLCQLTQPQLQRVIFPIGELQKLQVREIARQHELIVADKKDSQGICFVGKVDMQDFLEARIQPHEGNIVTTAGEVIGQHRGFEFYTIGQRGGLGIGGGTPYYVVERRSETNEVIVAVGDEDPALFRSELVATNLTETIDGNFAKYADQKISARIRYRQPLAGCSYGRVGDPSLRVTFDTPQRAVAPGQFIAFYVGDELIGSGIIA